jgi:TRAP-type uncharacterized transport system substrate-binding protein
MAIYPELLTLVTRKDANIHNLLDIKGKKSTLEIVEAVMKQLH